MKKTTSGANIEQRSIVTLPFPYTDFSNTKIRPVLILSQNDLIEKQEDIICCAITAQEKDFSEIVEINNSNMDQGKLKKDSRVIANKVMTIEKSKILKDIGKLSLKKSKETVRKLDEDIEIEE